MEQARRDYYFNLINENDCDQGKLFKTASALLGGSSQKQYPKHSDPTMLANDFGRFFTQKIDDIRSKLDRIDSSSNQPDYVQEYSYAGTPFTNFRPISSKRIKKLALNARCFQNFNFWVGASPATGEQISSETIIVMETARAYFLHVKKLCSSFTLEKFPSDKFWNNEELFACLHGILIESKQKELLAVISYLPLLFATRGIQDSVKKT